MTVYLGVKTGNGGIISMPSWLFWCQCTSCSESSMQNLTLYWANQYQFKALWFFLSNTVFWKLGRERVLFFIFLRFMGTLDMCLLRPCVPTVSYQWPHYLAFLKHRVRCFASLFPIPIFKRYSSYTPTLHPHCLSSPLPLPHKGICLWSHLASLWKTQHSGPDPSHQQPLCRQKKSFFFLFCFF